MAAHKTDVQLQAYLDALAETGVRKAACKAAGISYNVVYVRRGHDAVFAAAEDEALEQAADTLEMEAWRRAYGVESKFEIVDGEQIATEIKFSDTLLIFLLKGARPDKFKDRVANEMSGPGGRAIDVSDTTAAARIAGIFDAARQRREHTDKIDVDPLS